MISQNDILNSYLESISRSTNTQAALVGWLGYQQTMLVSLLVTAAGALRFAAISNTCTPFRLQSNPVFQLSRGGEQCMHHLIAPDPIHGPLDSTPFQLRNRGAASNNYSSESHGDG